MTLFLATADLAKSGGTQIAAPQGFFVHGRKGPLFENELKGAADWAKSVAGKE
jgi:hypothetical protein